MRKIITTVVIASLFLTFISIPLYFTGIIGRTVRVGDICIPAWNTNPFQECETNTVKEIRRGWVRYTDQMGHVHESKMNVFRTMYKKVGTTVEKP